MADESSTALDALLAEQRYVSPPSSFVEQANVTDPSIYDRFAEDWPEAFEEYAELLDWERRWDRVLDASDPPFYKWFTGGNLNASFNCLDRHLEERGDEAALIWEGEPGERETISYADLHRRVNETAAVLRDIGVEEDDIVTLHLPMTPALPITMLACARIGAPHSVVFAGFSAQAVATRMDDAGSRVLVTCDGYYRRGEFLPHKQKADEAVEMADVEVDDVLVWPRHDEVHEGTYMKAGRDRVMPELLADRRGVEVEPVSRDAEDVLFLMYTSGTTGRPKGAQHRTGGYLAWVTATSKYVLDLEPEDTYWCAADIGWITGHSYIVYGPLALGTTSVMYEGAPDHPHKGRTWEIAEELGVDVFHTSPTAVRMYMKWGEEYPERHDFDFRHLTTVGEPIQPEAWAWYWKHIGREEAVVVDTWWQTETGGHVITNLPALDDMKPGSAGRPLPGIGAEIVDDAGEKIAPGTRKAGNLVLTRPWPGMLQTLYGDDERFIDEYWAAFSDTRSDDWRDWVYRTGDGAFLAADGYFRILGRLDDVMNVAGHRLGTMELESAIVEVEEVAEAAVAPREDPEKGHVPVAYVILREGVRREGVEEKIREAVEEEIGKFARPAQITIVDDLPKTRSGKIMRRILENIANDEPLGDTTTLRDPDVPERIREQIHGE